MSIYVSGNRLASKLFNALVMSGCGTPARNVRFRGQSGQHLLILSFSGFDPVVGPRADIPSPEQLVAVRIPLTPVPRPGRL